VKVTAAFLSSDDEATSLQEKVIAVVGETTRGGSPDDGDELGLARVWRAR
jgi:hypothetical protein